jgi:hypothetical protein
MSGDLDNIFMTRVASPNKSRYILSHALLSPYFAIALHRQLACGADAARRALNNPFYKYQSIRLCLCELLTANCDGEQHD